MAGSFGYELDLNTLPQEEKEEVRKQVSDYKKYYELIHRGDYYRLNAPGDGKEFVAWAFVSEDKKQVLVNLVVTHTRANSKPDIYQAERSGCCCLSVGGGEVI